ncbi:MAG: sel1 repeat family protein [Gammaproteobacteria bacterium]
MKRLKWLAAVVLLSFARIVAADSIESLKELAAQGDAAAQLGVGAMYAIGQDVPQDFAEAVKWYRKAAEQGNSGGQFSLGLMYQNGRGVSKDFVQAHKWLNLAAAQKSGELQEKTAALRDELANRMLPEQVAEAQRLAREWKPTESKK